MNAKLADIIVACLTLPSDYCCSDSKSKSGKSTNLLCNLDLKCICIHEVNLYSLMQCIAMQWNGVVTITTFFKCKSTLNISIKTIKIVTIQAFVYH